jgi:hypothetical protein
MGNSIGLKASTKRECQANVIHNSTNLNSRVFL